MIDKILQVLIGSLFALFLPGYLIVKIFFEEFKILEKITFSVAFSIMLDIFIAIFLGYNEAWAQTTGGLTFPGIMMAEAVITIILVIAYVIKTSLTEKTEEKQEKETSYKQIKTAEKPKKQVKKKISKDKLKLKKTIQSNMFDKIKKKYNENKGLSQFIIRSLIIFTLVFGLYLIIFLWFRHTPFFIRNLRISDDFYFNFLTGLRKSDFLNATLFTIVIFVLFNRNTILKVKPYKQKWSQSLIFAFLAILSQILHYGFKYWIRMNPATAMKIPLLISLVKYFFNIAFILFLAIAVYNFHFVRFQFRKYKKQIPFFLGLLIVYFFLIQFFQTIWRFLGNFVARAIYFLLNLTFDNVYLNISAVRAPRLGVGNFIVGISEECSGIDSLLLFLSIYGVLLALDWNKINRKRMFILLVPGIIGTVLYNLFRVYLIMLVGIFISPEFAVDVFHTNVGWVLFLVFFIIFWNFGSKWVYEKE